MDRLAVIQSEETIRELREISDSAKILVADFKDLIRETNKVNNSLKSGKISDYTQAIRDLKDVTSQFTAIERQLAEALQRTARLETQQARTQAELARARRESASALREESRLRQQEARELASNARQTREASSAHAQLTRQVREARQTARDYGAEMFNLNQRLRQGNISQAEYRRQLAQMSRDFSNSSREAIRLQRELNRINQATMPSAQRNGGLLGRVNDIVKGVGIVAIIDNLASSFYKMGVQAFDTSVKLETLRLAQMAVFKTSSEVGRQNEFLTTIAQKYGIGLMGLTEAYTKFSASAQGTVLEGEQSKNVFDAVTRSSVMLGVSTDETTGILRALGQMMSKGKVQAEELRGQLGDRMAGAFKLFADGMGVSTAQLDKMLKDGKVITDDVLPKFANQLNKKYKLGINEEINTSQANITRLTNQWTNFVDAIENRAGVVSGTIGNLTGMFTGLLKEMTPSQFITDIQKQQVEFNKLGILLKNNFNDENQRKELIQQMIAINPNFLDGLDKEKVSLDEINERLRLTNEQYVQKILLQKYEDELTEILEEQGERINIIADAYAKNSEEMNNLTNAQQKVIQSFTDGKMTYLEADNALMKLGGNVYGAWKVLGNMDSAINNVYLTSKGFIRSSSQVSEALTDNTNKYNAQVKMIDKIIGASGNMLSMNNSLMNSNYALGGSYSFLAQQQAKVSKQKFDDAFKEAEGKGVNVALVNNVWREKINGKWTTTDKKQTDGWFEEFGKLVKRKSATLDDNLKKPKVPTYKGSRLDGGQRDTIKNLEAQRDTELALNEDKFTKGKIQEVKYLEDVLRINTEFYNKKMNFLTGKNAEEKKQIAQADLAQSKLEKETQKKIFDIKSKQLDEQYKIDSDVLERQSKRLEDNDTYTSVERLDKQIEIDSKSIQLATESYQKKLDLAITSAQDTLEIERKRDEEIGSLQDKRDTKIRSKNDALTEDLNVQTEFLKNTQELTFEEQKRAILANKNLDSTQKEYQISILEKANQIKQNELEIARLKVLRDQLKARMVLAQLNGITNPEDAGRLAGYDAEIANLENQNTETDAEVKRMYSEKMKIIKSVISDGFRNLGFENLANQFDTLFDKIMDKTATWRDYMKASASLVADALTSLSDKQKEKTIANLDEELKVSQENTEQELGFINGRLEQLNAMSDLNEEQITERTRLEDEARTYREQQQQREKLIATQKAKAMQKASAQQALINGALSATTTLAQLGFIAGAIPAGLALAFGVAQAISISSKNPVPEYFVGRNGGAKEMALTQERGAELITDAKGNVKTWGSNRGALMTQLEAGDNVYTAQETRNLLKKVGVVPKVGENLFQKLALNSIKSPIMPILADNNDDNSEKIAIEVGRQLERIYKRYDKPTIIRENGKIIKYFGSNLPTIIGEYDLKTLEENYYGKN